LLTHGGRCILDHPEIATVSTRIVTVVEDISVLVALTRTVHQAENAKPAYGHIHATARQKQRKMWACMESTNALQEMIASPNARKAILRNRGMLA